jgi:cell division inhibitor SepF
MNEDVCSDGSRQKGLFSKVVGSVSKTFGISEEVEDDYEDEENEPEVKKSPVLRLHSARVTHVAVRQPQSFDDARIAADGLKDGRQQIVNLEKTDQAMSERIIDFLNGVTYALNGFVEKVGERVYLFAPSNVQIEVQEELHKNSPGLFERTP